MRLRKHVLDLLTGPDIPVWYAVCFHVLFKLRPLLTFPLCHRAFSDSLHDRKGLLAVHSLVDQVGHDIVTGTDRRGDRRFPGADQFLRIVEPYICPVRQARDTDQVRQGLRFRIYHHLNNEVRSELRDPKTANRTSPDIIRRDTKGRRVMEQRDHSLVVQRDLGRDEFVICFIIFIVHRRGADIFLQRLDHRRIIMSQDIEL